MRRPQSGVGSKVRLQDRCEEENDVRRDPTIELVLVTARRVQRRRLA